MFEIPIEIDFIDGEGCHIFVKALLNDTYEALLIIDTGASKTVLEKNLTEHLIQKIEFDTEELNNHITDKLTPEQREELGLGSEGVVSVGVSKGKIDFYFGILPKIQMADFELDNFEVAYIDLSNVNDLYKALGKPLIWGLLGGDFLLRFQAVIDYKNKKMILQN
jgi:predicted aspartyl protease